MTGVGTVPFCPRSELAICAQVPLAAELPVQWLLPSSVLWSGPSSWEVILYPWDTWAAQRATYSWGKLFPDGLSAFKYQVGRPPGWICKTLPFSCLPRVSGCRHGPSDVRKARASLLCCPYQFYLYFLPFSKGRALMALKEDSVGPSPVISARMLLLFQEEMTCI